MALFDETNRPTLLVFFDVIFGHQYRPENHAFFRSHRIAHDVITNILLIVYLLLMSAVDAPCRSTMSADTVGG